MKARRPPQPHADKKKKILIVDDHSVVREGLATVINQQPDLMVCAQADSAAKALSIIPAAMPDAAIVDISLEGRSGLELIKDLKARHPDLPVMALSMHDETLYAERALRAGARGYVMKKESTHDMVTGLRRVLEGGFHVSERMASRILRQYANHEPATPRSPVELLSDRELEVFQFIGQGVGTRQIAERLHLSMKTVSCYRQNIKTKLNLKNASELVSHAIHWASRQQVD
jgi:DNA-binding NarL/FixJ family response regulator